jgi:hypothetical protein
VLDEVRLLGLRFARDARPGALPAEVAVQRLRLRAGERLAGRRPLAALAAWLGEGPPDVESVVAALRARRLFACLELEGTLSPVAVPGEADEEEAPPTPRWTREQKTWVVIEAVDDRGDPVPFVRYRVELPDHQVREGVLDEHGRAELRGVDPGTCAVSFPDLDRREWAKA